MSQAPAAPVAEALDEARMREFVETFERAWADPASGRLADLWAEDAESFHPEHPEPKRGRAEILAYVEQILQFVPDLTVQPVAAAANGDTLFVHFRSEGTVAGRRLTWEGVDRFDFRPGEARATRGVGFFDTAAFRDAVRTAVTGRPGEDG